MTAAEPEDETEVVVIGSGFGGSVATLRFAEAGYRVVVLERGDHVRRDRFQADIDALWSPERASYGFHDLKARGKPIIPWIGAAVGGGSHVYAGTLKRRDDWDGFPQAIRATDMTPYYERAEEMLGSTPFPDWEPYKSVRATQLMYRAGERLKRQAPDLVEDWGPVHLGISFAPPGGVPGAEFINKHGCKQRYSDPREQSILGGDIDTKNSLDRNYLFVAQHRAKQPAEIRPLSEVDKIERLSDGRYRIHYVEHVPPSNGWQTLRRRWLPFRPAPATVARCIVAKYVVVAAGAVGSTELLLRNKSLHKSLPSLGAPLGTRYTTNGDYLTLLVKFRGLAFSWAGFAIMVACAVLGFWTWVAIGAVLYWGGLVFSRDEVDADLGTTNSDNIRFKGPTGQSQGAYIESGRYPTVGRLLIAVLVSGVAGRFPPSSYRRVIVVTKLLRWLVPPLGAIARTFPIPLLSMGRDNAFGVFRLNAEGRAEIDYDLQAARPFYAYLESLGRKVAKAADAYWLPHLPFKLLGRMEVPHNQGGAPMGESRTDGVVDHAGRVFGVANMMVLDGSIIPVSVGPNPALTITAVAERAMEVVLGQLAATGEIVASEPPT
ncbi:MAG: GMC oxidoreductase [Polyangiaceae bacterium]